MTQIVAVKQNTKALQQSLQQLSTKKIVFLTPKDNLREALKMRNDFALKNQMPTEIHIQDNDLSKLCSILTKYQDAVVHLIDHDHSNYYLLNASFLCGVPVYFTNGKGVERIPSLPIKFSELLSEIQVNILNTLRQGPLTLQEVARRNRIDENMLFYYLNGRNALKGLIKLGMVAQREENLELTDFGRLVIST